MFSVQYTQGSTAEQYDFVGVQSFVFGHVPSYSRGVPPISDPIDALSGGIYRFNLVGFWEVEAGLSLVKRDDYEHTEFSCWGWFDQEEPFLGLQRVNVEDEEGLNQKQVAMSFHHSLYVTQAQADEDAEFSVVFGPTSGSSSTSEIHVSYLAGGNWIKFTYLGDA